MRNVKIKIGVYLFKKLIHTGHGSSAIYIVITKYKNLFIIIKSRYYSLNGFVHVFHKPGTMQGR